VNGVDSCSGPSATGLNRVAIGTFVALSGYHKLFNASRHATLARTLEEDGMPALQLTHVYLRIQRGMRTHPRPGFSSGSVRPLPLSPGAVAVDGITRICGWQPLNRADWLDDLLYLPESLYCVALAIVMLAGPGSWSLNAMIAARLEMQASAVMVDVPATHSRRP
jgi:hypothetical protein